MRQVCLERKFAKSLATQNSLVSRVEGERLEEIVEVAPCYQILDSELPKPVPKTEKMVAGEFSHSSRNPHAHFGIVGIVIKVPLEGDQPDSETVGDRFGVTKFCVLLIKCTKRKYMFVPLRCTQNGSGIQTAAQCYGRLTQNRQGTHASRHGNRLCQPLCNFFVRVIAQIFSLPICVPSRRSATRARLTQPKAMNAAEIEGDDLTIV